VINERSLLAISLTAEQSRHFAHRKFVRQKFTVVAGALIVLSMIAGVLVVFLTSFRKVTFHRRDAEESLYELNSLKTKHT